MQLVTEKKQVSPCSLCANGRKIVAKNNRNSWSECSLPLDIFEECCKSGCRKSFKRRIAKKQ